MKGAFLRNTPVSKRCPIVDVHAHMCDPGFDNDRDHVLERARQAGVAAVVAVGEDLEDAHKNVALSGKHRMLKAAAGLYPTHLDLEMAEEMVAFIRLHCDHLVAIGEVGLDYWAVQEEEARGVQQEIFKRFIDLSKEVDLPLNVHSRSAGRHAIAMLLERGASLVQMHAFDGKASAALPGAEAGFFFSIPPSVVRSRQKQKLVKQLPLNCLLVETDSPVLGPDPSERNEPANAVIAVKAIAQIKELEEQEVLSALWGNTLRLYDNIAVDFKP